MNFIETQQREAHMAGLAKSKNAKDCGDLTVLPLGYVSGITKQTITNTLNHILESGLLEEKPLIKNIAYTKENAEATIYNTLARAIRTLLDSMKV